MTPTTLWVRRSSAAPRMLGPGIAAARRARTYRCASAVRSIASCASGPASRRQVPVHGRYPPSTGGPLPTGALGSHLLRAGTFAVRTKGNHLPNRILSRGAGSVNVRVAQRTGGYSCKYCAQNPAHADVRTDGAASRVWRYTATARAPNTCFWAGAPTSAGYPTHAMGARITTALYRLPLRIRSLPLVTFSPQPGHG